MENYATLANVSAWLMIVYFVIVSLVAVGFIFIAIYKPDNIKFQKDKFVNKVISLLTFAAVLYNTYVLISLNQVFLPVILTVIYGITFSWSKFAIYFHKKQLQEFNK